MKIESNQKELDYIMQKPIIKNPDLIFWTKSKNFSILKDKFMHKSNEIILRKTHDLETIKQTPALKNRLNDYLNFNQNKLDKIKSSKVIKNPNIMLEDYKNELKIYEEKMDKINQVIILKKEQQKQKRIYLGIIAAIVIAVILIIIFGGIL